MRRILASPVQRHGLRPCDRPEIRNQRSGQTRRTRPRTPFGYEAGIRKFRAVSLSSAPWECRTPTCLKTRSEHGLLYPNTAGHRHIPSCMTESLHVAGRDLRFPWFNSSQTPLRRCPRTQKHLPIYPPPITTQSPCLRTYSRNVCHQIHQTTGIKKYW